MIRTDEEAAEVFAQLARKDVDPEVFWANLGWDFAMIRKIGKLGAEMNAATTAHAHGRSP